MEEGRGSLHVGGGDQAGAVPAGSPWLVVATPEVPAPATGPTGWRRPLAQQLGSIAAVLVLVLVAGLVAARWLAEREAVAEALDATDLLAHSVVEPALGEGLLAADPAVAAVAVAQLDQVVRARVLTRNLIRVKVWTREGRVVYCDEPALIGEVFVLAPDDLQTLQDGRTVGEVSDLRRPENRFERPAGKLLEVYRGIRTPGGSVLMFETYFRYALVTARTTALWRGFAGVTAACLLAMLVLQAPLSWLLIIRLRRAQHQREGLLLRAASAVEQERQRIAATLHDGVVQDLVGSSLALAGSAQRAEDAGQGELATRLRGTTGTVRASVGALRTLLVDIYPPNLQAAGLRAALEDLAGGLRARGIEVDVHVEAEPLAGPRAQELVYRIAQESLRNAERHAAAGTVELTVRRAGAAVQLEVADDGAGFDAGAVLARPAAGHLGLQVMRDLTARGGGTLSVTSRPGHGTRWRLDVPADAR